MLKCYALQAVIVMSDDYTYTLTTGQVLGSARQPLDILYIPAVLAFVASPVSPQVTFPVPNMQQESSCLFILPS